MGRLNKSPIEAPAPPPPDQPPLGAGSEIDGTEKPPPPSSVQPTSVTLTLSGATTLTATSSLRNTTTGVVTANFSISSTATPGAYTVNTVFGPNTWSLTSGFTINSN